MKLHAVQDRNDDRKRASDAWDLFRLIDLTSGEREFFDQIADAPPGLVELVGDVVERISRHDVTRPRRWIQVYGGDEWAALANEGAIIEAAAAVAPDVPWRRD